MELNLRELRPTNWRGLPTPGFDLVGRLTSDSQEVLAVLNARCGVRVRTQEHGGRWVDVDPNAPFVLMGPLTPHSDGAHASIHVRLPHLLLKAIEECRNGEGGVFVALDPVVVAAPIHEVGPRSLLGSPSTWVPKINGQVNLPGAVPIPRDEWLKLLKVMGFNHMEVFELPVFAHPALPGMQKAIEALRGAEQAMGLGDWPSVMSKTRGAFEAVATLAGKTKNVKAGFEKFWLSAFPDDADKELRDALDGIVERLAAFQHLGRHTKHPFPEIQKPEALLALRQTLALFEYVGERLKKREATP